MVKLLRFVSVWMCVSLALAAGAQATGRLVLVGTGGVNGVYYPAGGAMCQFVKRNIKQHGIRCTVESTEGSIYNLESLRSGDLDIAAAQSDWHYNAYQGKGPFEKEGPNRELRSLFSLHTEPFTILARANSSIHSFDDLRGHRISVGEQGSGMRATMEELMRVKGWKTDAFRPVTDLKPAEQIKALCDGRIDAITFAAGHPNGFMQEATSECDTRLVPITGKDVAELLKLYPYYTRAVIPGGMYRGNPQDTETFGMVATFVTTTRLSDDTVYNIVKSLFDNLDDFKTLHFVFAGLDKHHMVKDGLTAPLHDGAARYYREVGLIK